MPKVTYVSAAGETTTLELEEGVSVMEGAVVNAVEGIVGECGGSLMCATCHCYVDGQYLDRLPPRSEAEHEMLECAAADVKFNSRLGCQIKLTDDLDGLVVHMPADQY